MQGDRGTLEIVRIFLYLDKNLQLQFAIDKRGGCKKKGEKRVGQGRKAGAINLIKRKICVVGKKD